MEIRAELKKAIRAFDKFVYTNRIYMPLVTMVGTSTFFAMSQEYSFLFSSSFVIGTGVAAFTGVKLAEMYVKLNKALDKLNKETLPVTNQALEDLAKILPEVDEILNGIMHPVEGIQNRVHQKLDGVTDKASEFVGGLLQLMHIYKKDKKTAIESSAHVEQPKPVKVKKRDSLRNVN